MQRTRQFILLFMCLTLILGSYPAAARNEAPLEALWIDLSLGGPLIDLYNTTAQPRDIARVEHFSQVALLRDVAVGRRLVVFKSAEQAVDVVPAIAGQFDIIGYNIEGGPANPAAEQADPVAAAQRVRELADEFGLLVAIGPDRRFALSHGVELAPYADIFVLQVQRVQTEPDTVQSFVLPLTEALRAANPDLEVSVQIRTEGEVTDLLDLLESLKRELDGISVLTSVETVPVAEAFMTSLREVHPAGMPEGEPAADDSESSLVDAASTPENVSTSDDAAATASSGGFARETTRFIAIGGFVALFALIAGYLTRHAGDY